MAFRIRKNETLEKGIKRVGIERLQMAMDQLENNDNKESAIHSTRKKFKEIRALLRLIRDHVGKEFYRRENMFFRDSGREFAELRDNTVILEKLAPMERKIDEPQQIEDFRNFLDAFGSEKDHKLHRLTEEEGLMDTMKRLVNQGIDRVKNWPVEQDHFDIIQPGIHRVFKRGLKARKLAYSSPSIDNFHELRKRVKYLWLQTAFLSNAWPEILEPLADQLHLLSDWLGEDHDYGLVIVGFENGKLQIDSPVLQQKLLDIAQAERKKLEDQAYPLLLKVYAEDPPQFVKRIHAIWLAWRQHD